MPFNLSTAPSCVSQLLYSQEELASRFFCVFFFFYINMSKRKFVVLKWSPPQSKTFEADVVSLTSVPFSVAPTGSVCLIISENGVSR